MRLGSFAELERVFGYERAKEIWGKHNKKSKYGNVKTEVDGIKFDSKAEANYYAVLCMLKSAGEITEFETQPKYELLPSFTTSGGVKVRGISYVSDFLVTYPDGRQEVVDVKGCETANYKNKRKLFLHKYCQDGLRFVEIIKGKRNEY